MTAENAQAPNWWHKFRAATTCAHAVLLLFVAMISSIAWPAPAEAGEQQQVAPPTPGPAVITSGCEYDYPPYCIVTEDKQADGFSVELLRAALEVMGREVSFKVGPWNEVKQDLAHGRIQCLPLVDRSPEREETFDFTFPYLTMHGTIVIRDEEKGIHTIADLRGKQVVVMRGDASEEYVRRIGLDATIITRPTFDNALRELSAGKHDAVVMQKLLALRLFEQIQAKNLATVGRPLEDFALTFCFAVRQGDKNLLGILNEGLSIVIADGTFRRLHAKWFAPIEFTGRSRIVVGGDHDYPPYEFLDENGQPAGYNVDLTRAIAKRMGISVDIQLGPRGDIRESLWKKELDVIQGLFYSPERDKKFDFSPAHTVVTHVLVTRDGTPELHGLNSLAGKSIVVLRGDIMHDVAIARGYEKQLVLAETLKDALCLLAEGKHDCALVARIPALYLMEKNGWTNLRIDERPILSPEYCYSVLYGNEELLAQFSEGLAAIKSTREYRDIHNKWFSVYEGTTPGMWTIVKYSLVIVAPILLLLVGSLVWSHALRKTVARRTSELKKEIAEHEQAEESLRESESRQRLILQAAGEGIYGLDLDGNTTFANATAGRLLGWAPEELIGRPQHDVIHHTKADGTPYKREECPIHAVFKDGEIHQVRDEVFWRADGTSFPVEYTSTPIRTPQNELVGVVVVFRDITERRQMEERLRQTEKMNAIGQLAGGIAHDFNNQLSGVLGYADLLENRLEDESLSRYATNIKKGAKRAAELTAQLLAFSRKGKNLSVPVNIHKVVSEVTDILEHSIDKRIKMRLALNASPATTVGDPNQLQNAIFNIALNARDAMPEGGELIFETELTELDEEFCKGHPYEVSPGSYLKISITDSGCGMDAETLKHIFEPFYTNKKVGQGTGMGLASVYGTVRNHKGAINVYSEVGRGTTFRIYLPLAEDARKEPEDNEHGEPIAGTARILLVDDEEVVREIATDMLKELGYKVTVCKNGKEAVDYYKKSWQEVDLVLLDMVMPELNGRDTFAAMKKVNPEVRAILSSGYSINGEAQTILGKGVMAFIGKPFGLAELSQKVAQVLRA